MNERKIQDCVNKRLSGLSSSEARRMRIRAAIYAEKQEVQPMKRKMSLALALTIAAALLLATLAIAESLNLFKLFGESDRRYASVADQAARATANPVRVDAQNLGEATATIDGAYFDGLTLNIAFQVQQGFSCAEYAPSEEELRDMEATDAMPVVVEENQPGSDVLTAYNRALESGTPFGYRASSVYASDHTLTSDGIDIPPYSASSHYAADGSYCEMREFATPLPPEIAERDALELRIALYREEVIVYFDGQRCYSARTRSEAGTLTAIVPRTAGSTQAMSGAGEIRGASCEARAQVSPMAATVTLTSAVPFDQLLAAPPEGVDPSDVWVEAIAIDESGQVYRPHESLDPNQSSATLSFLGTGALPETLTLYLYRTWEGADAPDLDTLEGIAMTVQ